MFYVGTFSPQPANIELPKSNRIVPETAAITMDVYKYRHSFDCADKSA